MLFFQDREIAGTTDLCRCRSSHSYGKRTLPPVSGPPARLSPLPTGSNLTLINSNLNRTDEGGLDRDSCPNIRRKSQALQATSLSPQDSAHSRPIEVLPLQP